MARLATYLRFFIAAAALHSLWYQPALHAAESGDQSHPKAIPFDQLGAEAAKQYHGSGVAIEPTATGAAVHSIFQRLEGKVSDEGLWLHSTVEGNSGAPFRLRAMKLRRGNELTHPLATRGIITVTPSLARYERPELIEEYSVGIDGVRQDFVIKQKPQGQGELRVLIAVDGANAQTSGDGIQLTLVDNARTLSYNRLHVTDADGNKLTAHFEVDATNQVAVLVDDVTALYPIRIDPTFSDANWMGVNTGLAGANNSVYALAADGSGNLYVGGAFTIIGSVTANRIAKWNGTTWSTLGAGLNGVALALAVSGTDLYAGGQFSTADDIAANSIAKWDGSAWSALGSGVGGSVYALAISGTDLYAGATSIAEAA